MLARALLADAALPPDHCTRGVMVVRSSHAALVAGVLRLYDAKAEATGRLLDHLAGLGVPELMRGSQEQGPLAYFLLKHARPGQVQPSPHALASI